MKMTKQEYEQLMNDIRFIADKLQSCYEQEIKSFVKELEQEYKKSVTK